MGWKSTVEITREEALYFICNAVMNELNDEALSDIVEIVMGGANHGHNYRIVYRPEPKTETEDD